MADTWEALVAMAEARGWDVQFVPPAEGFIPDTAVRELFSYLPAGHYMVYYTKNRCRMLYADARRVEQLAFLLAEVVDPDYLSPHEILENEDEYGHK